MNKRLAEGQCVWHSKITICLMNIFSLLIKDRIVVYSIVCVNIIISLLHNIVELVWNNLKSFLHGPSKASGGYL